MNELVSIIIPVYNVAPYLKKCLESVILQTYYNLEIIIIDDGSTDESAIICDSFSYQDERIKVIHKTNGGLSSARNKGIDVAHGDFLCFVDADDCINTSYVEILLKLAREYDAQMVQCDFLCIDKDSKYLPVTKNNKIEKYSGRQLLHKFCCGKDDVRYTVVWNKLYSSKLFENNRFEIGKQHEDEFIMHELIYKTETFVEINAYLYYYLQREDSIMGQGFSIKSLDALEAYHKRISFLGAHNLSEEYIATEEKLRNMYKLYYKNVHENIDDNKEILLKLRDEYKVIFQDDGILDFESNNLASAPLVDVSIFEKFFNYKWILYGAGFLGQKIYAAYKKYELETFLFCVDNYWQNYKHIDMQVKPIDRILDVSYDFILVGINDSKVAMQVKNNLMSWGVTADKIIIK